VYFSAPVIIGLKDKKGFGKMKDSKGGEKWG